MNPVRLDGVGFVLIAACLGVIQLSIFAGQSVLFSAAALVWVAVVWRDRRWPATPRFFLPLAIYAALTLVSAAVSVDPRASFVDSRQLVLFLMVPIVARFARGGRATKTIDVIIAIGSAGALVGIVQYAMFGYNHLNQRPVGLLSHYMTYSGVLMLVACAAVARLLFHPRDWVWPAVAVPALLAALAVTLSRSAYVGTALAVMGLVALRNWKLLLVAPVLFVIGFAIAPGVVQNRLRSALDSNDASRRDRVAMLAMSVAITRDHPFFGVGPEMIPKVYAEYRPDYGVNATNPHLHNVVAQIAAERGLPALAAFLWFVAVAFWDVLKQVRHGPARAVAGAGLAAVVGMMGAGLLEYNFGDSEFLMLFLGLITLPFAAAQAVREDAAS